MEPIMISATKTSDKGLSLVHLLENAWILPALIKGAKECFWEQPLNAIVDENGGYTTSPVFYYWEVLGLIELMSEEFDPEDKSKVISGEFQLTDSGKRVVQMLPWLEYEFSMMNQQLDANFVTDPGKYEKLRDALAEYSYIYLDRMHEWVEKYVHKGMKVLDFGGGSGAYLDTAMHKAVDGFGVLLDKAPQGEHLERKFGDSVEVLTCNFREGDMERFVEEHKDAPFDIIIVSEVLHVLSKPDRLKAISDLSRVLSVGGVLLVIEQVPNLRLAWRMFDMTAAGRSLHVEEIIEEIVSENAQTGLIPDLTDCPVVAASHFGISFTKREVKYVS